MSDQLISRDALKKALELTDYNDIYDLTMTERLIDNAATVNPCKNCDLYFKATTKEIDRWYKKEEQKGGVE